MMMMKAGRRIKEETAYGFAEATDCIREAIAGHFAALKEVCEAHGINYKTVLERNGITENPDNMAGVDQEYKARTIEALETLLSID